MRTFVGIKIPSTYAIPELKSHIESGYDTARFNWTKDSNIHLTLLFLGNTNDIDLAIVKTTMQEVALKNNAFNLEVKGLNIFSKRKDKSILWLDIKPSEALNILRNDIFNSLQPKLTGVNLEQTIFTPHVTIARYPKAVEFDTSMFEKYSNHVWFRSTINEFALFESRSTPTGIEYHIIESYSSSERTHEL